MSRPLIGRDRELDVLRATVATVASGSPASVLLNGPPGVGKTRLAREALAMAATSGFATYDGRAHELDREVAYAPIVAALGTALRNVPADRLSTLAGDLPQLGLLFSGLELGVPTPLRDPALERARLLNALSQLIDRLARERPVALLIDDVHLADASTLAFLQYLIDVLTDRPVLMILTARTGEPGAAHLTTFARALTESTWAVEQVTVGALPDTDTALLIESVLGAPAEASLSAAIAERCGGRPLFIEAITRTLFENGQLVTADGLARASSPDLPLPEVVRDQLRIRLAGLSGEERAVLDTLAAADGGLDHQLLVRATELPTHALLTALDGLHRRALLGPGRATAPYELVHALLRDTLLAEMSPAHATRLHAGLADGLIEEDSQHRRAAEHVLLALDLIAPERAVETLIRGATESTALGASESAARYLRVAARVSERLGRMPEAAGLRAQLATALRRSADAGTARAAWEDARQSYTALGDDVGVSRAEQELGMLAWSEGELDRARAHFGAAERSLDGLAASAAHARVMFGKVVIASRIGDTETVEHAARELRGLSTLLRSPELTAQALLAQAVIDYAATDYVRMVSTNLAARDAARCADDRVLELRATDQLSVAYASQLDITGLRRSTMESLRIAKELGSPALSGWPRCRLAAADLLTGDWDSALRNTTEMCEITRRFNERRGSVSADATHAWVLVRLGHHADAERCLETARERAQPMLEADRNIFTIVAIAGATAALAQGRPAEAVQRAAQLEEMSGGWLPILGITLLGEARARTGDLDGAESIVERLRGVVSCATVAPTALAEWVQGTIDVQRCATDDSAGHFDAAADGFETLGMPFFTGRAQLGAATALAGSNPEGSAVRGKAALEVFDRLGAAVEAKTARDLLRGLGITPSRGRRRGAPDGALSPRELEVARLVASGMTNAAVATELFISPRTVTTHLDRIYAKLTLTSRVALTRYLADSGLLAEGIDTQYVPRSNT